MKKLGGGDYRTANIVYAARCKTHGDIHIGNTGQKLRDNSMMPENNKQTR